MISDDINADHLLMEIDQQIELLEAMADRSAVFAEQLRVFREARALLTTQALQIQRLEELVDDAAIPELQSIVRLGERDD